MSTHLDNRDRYERITGDRTAPWHPEWLLPDHYPTDTRLPFNVAMFRARHVAEPHITEGPTIRPTRERRPMTRSTPPPCVSLHRRIDWWHVLGLALCALSAVLVVAIAFLAVAWLLTP